MAYCTRGDLIGTIQPDGSPVLFTGDNDDVLIEKVGAEIDRVIDPDADQSAHALRWANVIGVCDLRTDDKLGPAFNLAVTALILKPSEKVSSKKKLKNGKPSAGESN
jgi:hypothetical protein